VWPEIFFPAATEGVQGYSIIRTELFGSKGELKEAKWDDTTRREPSWWGFEGVSVSRLGAIEEWIEDLISFKLLIAFLDAEVVSCTRKTEQMIWQIGVHWKEKLDTFVMIFRLRQCSPMLLTN
jgi:hypothetical protein